MIAVVLLSAVTVFCLVMALLYKSGKESDRKKARLNDVKTTQSAERHTDRKKEGSRLGSIKKLRSSIKDRQRSKVLGQQISNSKSKKKLTEAEKMLMVANVQLTGFQFSLIKLLLGVVLAVVFYFGCNILAEKGILDAKLVLLLTAAGAILGDILPAQWLKSKVAKRKALYRDQLPDVMDLLVVSVEAGLGFDSALIRLYQKDKSPLMQEMMRAMQDIQYGMSKKEAYSNLSLRCGVKELTSFVNALVQADQMGVSVRTVLKTQSEALREQRRQRAEEKALKAPVKMLLPMVIFIFPVIFIVILGPAIMNMTQLMG